MTGRKKKIIKRCEERIPSNLIVKFFKENEICYGIAKNISGKGMCINTGYCLPCEASSSVLIPLGDDHIEIKFRVRWVKKTGDFYDAMGVELINVHERYTKLIENLRAGVGV